MKIPKYICSFDACNPEELNILIVGNHFTEKKAMEVMINKQVVSKEDNLEIIDLYYGWAKYVKDITEHCSCSEEEGSGYIFEICSVQPEGYNRKATIVELAEICD